ncbi:MAG TPA: aminotransferase class I/II-fold pyridoxal phosphate-dependent enzyme [Mariniphaga sp.]|nr:aminotransferase class I/II-fold pyridoxal phosphate-dependent enzyme [Mariniphaga sp.]
MKKTGFTTKALNVKFPSNDPYNSMQMPLYESVAYEFDSSEQIEANFKGEYVAHTYSRTSNPTVEYLELKLKLLLNAKNVLAVGSGMAAISNTLLSVLKSGDNVISGHQLFGHTYALFSKTFKDLGIDFRFSSLTSKDEIEALIDGNTRAIYFETVTNPQLDIADIKMLSEISGKYNILLIADSTITPPNIFDGKKAGVDIEVISATKYLSGGGTCFGGIIVDYGDYKWELNPNLAEYSDKYKDKAFIAKLRKNVFRNTGGSISPQAALTLIHGIDILELRVEKCYKNCISLCSFLYDHPAVKQVGYPGYESDSRYYLAKKYFKGVPGTIITFDLESKEACYRFMNRLKVIRRATNLNDNKSLIIHPHSTIYGEFSEDERQKAGIRNTMLRLSVGIENHEDLIQDIKQAIEFE